MVSKICLSNDILLNSCSTLHSCESVVPENIHTPPRKGSDFPGGGGSICLIFQWEEGGGVTIGKYFQRVLVTRKRVTKKKHKNLPGQFICKHIKHDES